MSVFCVAPRPMLIGSFLLMPAALSTPTSRKFSGSPFLAGWSSVVARLNRATLVAWRNT